MAENIIETRILLRYGTINQWMNSTVILKTGEAAVAAFPLNRTITNTNSTPENTPPAIGIKIGDGIHYFSELPWVQGIAADVYNWAKQITKPTYTASEIQGLQSYIEEHTSGAGDGTIAPRLYQIIQGTGDDVNKYYLQYKESTENNWTIDVNHYIDLEDLVKIKAWIGNDIDEYPNLSTRTGYQTLQLINNIKYTDTETNKYYVVAVNQSAGKISTVKRQPAFSDLQGVATVEQGGTGLTTLPVGQVLIGNGNGAIYGRPIAEEITNNNHLVPNYLVKSYIDKAVEGLTGAMHFIGEASVVINPNSSVDPNIPGYELANAQPGDVILYNAQEYVWTGGNWRLLGDEGSYAVKGSITDADIASDANIQQSKIFNLDNTLARKVDVQEGKQLSTNDYTNEEKQKLENIDAGAQVNYIEHVMLNGQEITPATIEGTHKTVNIEIDTITEAERLKLATIENEAQVNKIESISVNGTNVAPDDNKNIEITIDPHLEHKNKIEKVFFNDIEYPPNADKEVHVTIDEAALNLEVIKGARVPAGNGLFEDVDITNQKKLNLARIAKTGNVEDLLQINNTYVILNCGSSTDVI